MAEKARVVHAIQGRVRLKVPELRTNAALAQRVGDRFSAVPGVRRVDTNPVTGSLLVEYDPAGLDLAEALRALEELSGALGGTVLDGDGLGALKTWISSPSNGVGAASPSAPGAGPRSGAGVRSLLPLSLAALGVGRLLSGNVAPPQWYDLLWFAFSAHHLLNRRESGVA